MTIWQMGMFDVLAGEVEAPTVCTIAGWYREPFGIDRRWMVEDDGTLKPCWMITHLLTGYNICGYLGEEDQAKAVCEQIEKFGDWDFTSPLGAKSLSARMAEFFKSNSDIFSPAICLPALWLRVKARA